MCYEDTFEHQVARRNYSGNGDLVIPSTKNVLLGEICVGLMDSGFELVGAFRQEREVPVPWHRSFRPPRHIVRFTFLRKEDIEHWDDAQDYDENVVALHQMCKTTLWQTMVSKNPVFKDSEPVEGQSAVSINCNERTPLFHLDGKPQMRWQKDEYGNRVGDAPLPLQPAYCLGVCIGLTHIE
ncbi:MAG: hypothetical protein U9P90_00145 [Patescibacteria group bacterium]|nr:hypothetical protein [Patescibacteria group bacterium]